MYYTLPKVSTNYGLFNIRFKGFKVWNSRSENLKTFSISNFKESVKRELVKDYQFNVLISSCVVFQFTYKLVFCNFCHLSKSFFYSLIYSCYQLPYSCCVLFLYYFVFIYLYITLTILDFLHSIKIASFLLVCAFVFHFHFFADPVSYFYLMLKLIGCLASLVPRGYSRQLVIQFLLSIFFIEFCIFFPFSKRVSTNKD